MSGESDLDCQISTMGLCSKIHGYAQKRSRHVSFFSASRGDGFRRCAYMMIDKNVAYAVPSTVYRVLKEAGMLQKKADDTSKLKALNSLRSPMTTYIRIFHMSKFNIAFTFLSVCWTVIAVTSFIGISERT